MKIKKGYTTKAGFNNTINIDVLKAFHEVANKKAINKSKLIENFLIKWTGENK